MPCEDDNVSFLTRLQLVRPLTLHCRGRTGCFDNIGVVNLNQRAEAVTDRLGVPVVQGYDISHDQAWATLSEDGR